MKNKESIGLKAEGLEGSVALHPRAKSAVVLRLRSKQGSALIMVLIVTSSIAWVLMLSWRSSLLAINTAALHQKVEQRMRSAQAFALVVVKAVHAAQPQLLQQLSADERLILACDSWPLGDGSHAVIQAYGRRVDSSIAITIFLTDDSLKLRLYTITYSMSKDDEQTDEYDDRWSIKEWREMA